MDILNIDVRRHMLSLFVERDDALCLLRQFLMLNRQWSALAVEHLYKDPWTRWQHQFVNQPVRAKQLIDTFNKCLQSYETNNSTTIAIDRPTRRSRPDTYLVTTSKFEIPLWDYVSMVKNLHVPALYKCVEVWNRHTPNMDNSQEFLYRKFNELFQAFVQKAQIKACTFEESAEKSSYPQRPGQLAFMATSLHARGVDLRYLNLGYFECTDEDLRVLAANCNQLETFKIRATRCSDEALANFISSQKRLIKLKIRLAGDIKSTLEEAIGSQAASLVKLRIIACRMSSCSKPFIGIAACKQLRSLYIRNASDFTTNSSISMMPVARNCEFHNVDFSGTNIPAAVIATIAEMSKLTLRKVHIKRANYYVGEDDELLTQQLLDMSAGIRALGDHAKNLAEFERNILPIEADALIYMLRLIGHQLHRLEIGSNAMASRESSDLVTAIGCYCPNITSLDISCFLFSEGAFSEILRGCNKLQTLYLHNIPIVNDTFLHMIGEELGGTLKDLYLSNHRASVEAVAELDQIMDVIDEEGYEDEDY
ncbi:668_t:CDS:2 [Paraglomus brasilianum]|uniref:668_t:CDS:1 n=1 Tax=Paraglomus brasilianum TaxID=144538 RepID=A0A9N8WEF3_9GLOM|nr:668_t:CDS:2 [Paraglomus brasilianum]